MSLTDNILRLKKMNPKLWKQLKPFMDSLEASPIVLKESRSGLPTLAYEKDGTVIYIHSAYDPKHEAAVFARKLGESDLSSYNHVFFYGIGLGYHIEAFLKEHPDMFFTIYEPNPYAFCHFMNHRNLDDLPLRRMKSLYILFEPGDAEGITIDFFYRYHDKPFFVTLPAYERLYKKEFDHFTTFFTDAINLILSNRYTQLAYEKRWTINSMLNFVSNLYNRNILNHEEGMFKGKPAIMVAAGPSLQDEYENLRKIREEGTAYIFSIGSAIKGLVANGIEPHGTLTMDPGEHNKYEFTDIIEKNITTIPLIYGTSAGFESIQAYPGPKLFMTMDKDTVTPFFLKNEDNAPMGMVNDAPTVAITSQQLLCLLGFNPIILVGQNLGFRNNQNYAKGVVYDEKSGNRDHMATERELADIQTTVNVYGKKMQTNKIYILFRKTMEKVISLFPATKFINTTRGGARINGAKFKKLDALMADQLVSRVVDEQWIEKIKQGGYDVKYLLARKDRMRNSLINLKRRLDEMGNILADLEKHISFHNPRQLEGDFLRLDKIFKEITKNDFYRTFLTPLNMLETAIFGNGMASVRAEILHAERAEHVVSNFGLYVRQCNRDINNITDVLFPYIEANIDQFQKWKIDHDSVATISPPEIIPSVPELSESMDEMTEQMAVL